MNGRGQKGRVEREKAAAEPGLEIQGSRPDRQLETKFGDRLHEYFGPALTAVKSKSYFQKTQIVLQKNLQMKKRFSKDANSFTKKIFGRK